jgi:GntR family transcriptional repressor for pyruvate dehydrogenase complex
MAEIQSRIIEGALTPGMMLPPERELCEQLGVSRTALREAVRMLVTKGLLETRPGVGTIVMQVTSGHVSEPLSMMMSQNGSIDLGHLHEVRQVLEVEIVRLAALKATREDIERLRNVYEQMLACKDDHAAFTVLDSEFHRALALMTHNPLLSILLDTVRDAMGSVRQMVEEYPGLYEMVMPDHKNILKEVEAHDAEAAVTAMRTHLEHARRLQQQLIGEQASVSISR